MIFSNYSLINAFYFGTIRMILEFTSLLYAAFKVDYNHFSGILRALGWIMLNPRSIARRRRNFKKIRILEDKDILKKLCRTPIVIAHFILDKKTYSYIFMRYDWYWSLLSGSNSFKSINNSFWPSLDSISAISSDWDFKKYCVWLSLPISR